MKPQDISTHLKEWKISKMISPFAVPGWYESVFIFVILLCIEWMIPGPASLARLSPHPFWIPVILISSQYGSASGLSITGCAVALSWLAGWPEQTAQEDFYRYSMRIWREPILWIFGSLIMGCLRDRQIRQRDRLRERVELAELQRETLGAFAEDLQTALFDYERTLAISDANSMSAAVSALQALRKGAETDLPSALPFAISKWLGDVNWAFYTWPFHDPALSGARSISGELAWRDAPQVKATLAYCLRHRRKVLTVFDAADAAVLDGLAAFAVIVGPRNRGTPRGILLIEAVQPDRMVPEISEALRVLADALAEALERTRPRLLDVTLSEGRMRSLAKRAKRYTAAPFTPSSARGV
jgi:hypothetical protein